MASGAAVVSGFCLGSAPPFTHARRQRLNSTHARRRRLGARTPEGGGSEHASPEAAAQEHVRPEAAARSPLSGNPMYARNDFESRRYVQIGMQVWRLKPCFGLVSCLARARNLESFMQASAKPSKPAISHLGVVHYSLSQKWVHRRTFAKPFASFRMPHFLDVARILSLSNNMT